MESRKKSISLWKDGRKRKMVIRIKLTPLPYCKRVLKNSVLDWKFKLSSGQTYLVVRLVERHDVHQISEVIMVPL